MVCAPVRRDNPLARGIIDRTGAQTMLYLTCTIISSVTLRITEYLVLKIGYLWIVVQFLIMGKWEVAFKARSADILIKLLHRYSSSTI